MLSRFSVFVVLSLLSVGTVFAAGIEVDVAATGDYMPTEIEPLRQHFIKANPIDVKLQNLDKDLPKAEKFLKAVADEAVRIGPKGIIAVVTANKALVDDFQKQINRSQYAKDILVARVKPANACGPLLGAGVSVGNALAASGKDLDGFRDMLKFYSANLTPTFEKAIETTWNYLAETHSSAGQKGPLFKVLTLEGLDGVGKTYLLNHIAMYLGNYQIQNVAQFAEENSQSAAPVAQNRVAVYQMEHTRSEHPSSTSSPLLTNRLPPFYHANKQALQNALAMHDGSFPFLLMIDDMDWMYPTTAYFSEVISLIGDHIKALRGKEDSFKVIFSANPFSKGAYFLNSGGTGWFPANFVRHWNTLNGRQPAVVIEPVEVKL